MSREIDSEIAERIMGYKWYTYLNVSILFLNDDDRKNHSWWTAGKTGEPDVDSTHFYDSSRGGCTMPIVPHYSTDIKDAWDVVELLAKNGVGLTIRPYVSIEEQRGTYRVAIEAPLEVDYVTADNAPLGICLAALRAVELMEETPVTNCPDSSAP